MHPNLCRADQAALMILDMQPRFAPVVPAFEAVMGNCLLLARAFALLGRPVLVTEQYPKALGPTDGRLLGLLAPAPAPMAKTTFSALRTQAVADRLREAGARTVVLAGIETHVCVLQTAHDLLEQGIIVHLVCDAVASRRAGDHLAGVEKIVASGAVRTTVETVVLEMVGGREHPQFKALHALFTA